MAHGLAKCTGKNYDVVPQNRQPGREDRRLARRYPISCELQYRMLGREPREIGHGKTVNISSSGMLFLTDRLLAPRRKVEVLVQWPVKLNGQVGLNLVVLGEVVRVGSEGAIQAAIRIERYEFHTSAQKE
jgi:hypothetical protein